ncbi:MAG: hypothetical protein F4Y67_08530 [Chloroflexi bacterium]|nr:hypothetical protein [Chloroflexota bacterium]MXY00843.1 hypothetical protein [Chloroflexota bacterium]
MQFQKARRVDLRNHPGFSEADLEKRVIDDPGILGLGDLVVRGTQRRLPGGGRFDLLLEDPDDRVRYVVELQLGPTDASHIIRTIEYWDLEKRRFPNYEHVAVIVAEDLTSRFFNVVYLFNNFIPLIAIQIQGFEVGGTLALFPTRVLDLGVIDDEEVAEPTDRAYWEKRGSPDSLRLVDRVIADVVQQLEPGLQAKYNKHYIGLADGAAVKNFISFIPRKRYVVLVISLPQSDETTDQLEQMGLPLLAYERNFRNYRLQLTDEGFDRHKEELRGILAEAHERFGR